MDQIHSDIRAQLENRLADLLERAEVLEDDLRHPLDADFERAGQSTSSDDEALEGSG